LAAATGTDPVVFGTLLLARLQRAAGADRGMRKFINTLPQRIDLETHGVRECALANHARLAAQLDHEHPSLAQAQRWTGVAAP
ncbi:hypothetical protein, partial [Pseudomonas syringae group genomosp. 7]|uniref:hypothetical protein n=1 Tax=Pseudomonas syringae group genomosp. 7 TaxID=251699 RepID=UPI0037705F6B